MTKKRISIYLVLGVITVLCWLFIKTESSETDQEKIVRIALREAGNQLLLKNADSISLILPVKRIKKNTFELSFKDPLSFRPNELVESVKGAFIKADLPDNYITEVLMCTDQQVAYSYQIDKSEERTLIPCIDRKLPLACYTVQVAIKDLAGKTNRNPLFGYFFGALLLLLTVDYNRSRKANRDTSQSQPKGQSIGIFTFYPDQSILVKAAAEINLSNKECELLALFIERPNQIIKRDELQKRVWEDKGVVVGRSLDTYISKLRQKLKEDPAIKIINIHGVGYKLEIK